MYGKPPAPQAPPPPPADLSADLSAEALAQAEASAQADPGFAEAHRQLLADRSIQFELKGMEPPATPDWLAALARFFRAIWPGLEILFWVAVALVVLYLLYGLAMRLRGKEWPQLKRRPRAAAADDSWRPAEAPARALLEEADALAALGRYGEAARLILHRSVEDIHGRRPSLLGPALTSRDIAALPALPDRPRSAFTRIAALVERSLFARRDLAEGDWQEARAAYEDFAFADGWRG